MDKFNKALEKSATADLDIIETIVLNFGEQHASEARLIARLARLLPALTMATRAAVLEPENLGLAKLQSNIATRIYGAVITELVERNALPQSEEQELGRFYAKLVERGIQGFADAMKKAGEDE
jgi:hypothetical protein